jgi:hypothetical protein
MHDVVLMHVSTSQSSTHSDLSEYLSRPGNRKQVGTRQQDVSSYGRIWTRIDRKDQRANYLKKKQCKLDISCDIRSGESLRIESPKTKGAVQARHKYIKFPSVLNVNDDYD